MKIMYEFVSDSYDGRHLKVTIEIVKQNERDNSTLIYYNLISEGGNEDYYSIGETTLEINDVTYYHIDNRSLLTKKFPAATGDIGVRPISIPHNSDGTKKLKIVFKTSIGSILGEAVDYGGKIELASIDRTPPTLNLKVDKITDTSARLYIDTGNEACDSWEYLLNETYPYKFFDDYSTVSKGSFKELTALEANQTYTIKVRAAKYSNNVRAESNVVTFTTFGASILKSVQSITVDDSSVALNIYANVYNEEYNHSLSLYDKSTEILTLANKKLINGSNLITLTKEECNTILSYMSHCKEFIASLQLITSTSDLQVGEISSRPFKVQTSSNSYPDFSGFSYADISENAYTVTQNNQILIQDVSELQISALPATPKNYAEIVSYSVMAGNLTATSTESTIDVGKLSISGSVPIIVTAIDSRGYTASQTVIVNVLPYKKIDIISAAMERINKVDSFTKVKIVAEISPVIINGENKNPLKDVLYRYKRTDKNESYSNYYSIKDLIQITDNKLTFETNEWIDLELDPEFSYYVEFVFKDQFPKETLDRITLTVPQATPTVSFRKNKVGINNRTPRASLDVIGNIMMNDFNVLGFVRVLTVEDHLDSIIDCGTYESFGYEDKGYPTSGAGILLVIRTKSYITQFYWRYKDAAQIYFRKGVVKSSNIATWTRWREITSAAI